MRRLMPTFIAAAYFPAADAAFDYTRRRRCRHADAAERAMLMPLRFFTPLSITVAATLRCSDALLCYADGAFTLC